MVFIVVVGWAWSGSLEFAGRMGELYVLLLVAFSFTVCVLLRCGVVLRCVMSYSCYYHCSYLLSFYLPTFKGYILTPF